MGTYDLHAFEECRLQARRSKRQMCMNYYKRRDLLIAAFGHTLEDVEKAEKSVRKAKFLRGITEIKQKNPMFMPIDLAEVAAESLVRKVKRSLKKRKGKKN